MPSISNCTLRRYEIRLNDANYPYYYGYDCLGEIADSIGLLDADRFIVVTDDTVKQLHGTEFLTALSAHAPVEVLSSSPGEHLKSMSYLTSCVQQTIRAGASKRSVVVAFGGGVPGNLAGVIAGLLFRGIRLVHVPTTTVAAMDSTISLKQAINSHYGKNQIGIYCKPEAVYTDARFLQTLPARELRSGLAEALKNTLAIRPDSIPAFRKLLNSGDLESEPALLWLLEESLAAKMSVMKTDFKEQRAGLLLEYGHTVGHAVEIRDRRLRPERGVSHGDAVAVGMLAAARVSQELGGLSSKEVALHYELVTALGCPTSIPADLSPEDVLTTVLGDNKRGYLSLERNEVAMVLLSEIGTVLGDPDSPLTAVPLSVVRDSVRSLCITSTTSEKRRGQ